MPGGVRHASRDPPRRAAVDTRVPGADGRARLDASANATINHKVNRRKHLPVAFQLLEEAGLVPCVAVYLRRLCDLESGRPPPGGNRWHFQAVSLYRVAVVRLSLGMIATTAGGDRCLDEAVEATHGSGDLNHLFRIVMPRQITDDVLDDSRDRSAGLPSFLTAYRSLPQALELTRWAVQAYAGDRHMGRPADVFQLQVALFLVSMVTELLVGFRRFECGGRQIEQSALGTDWPGMPIAEAASVGMEMVAVTKFTGKVNVDFSSLL